jgi:enoyl-CoA hydratase
MDYQTITVEPGVITRIGLNRPERRNAINLQLEHDLTEALLAAERDADCRVVILFGHGPVFSAGHDLYEVAAMFAEGSSGMLRGYGKRSLQEHVWNIQKPIISAVHGFVGPHAVYLIACTDLIIAAEGTRFSMEQMRRGGATGFPLITFIIGEKRYKEWRLLARALDAATLADWGLVNTVVPAEQLMATATQWAEWIAAIPPQNALANKLAVNKDVERLGLWELAKLGSLYGMMGHGSETDKDFFRKVMAEGLRPALRDRDANFTGQDGTR